MKLAAILITATLAFPGPSWEISVTPALQINVPAPIPAPAGPQAGLTLPYLILCHACTPVEEAHEQIHIRQWALLGPWLAPLYAVNRAPFEDYLGSPMFTPPLRAEANRYPFLRISDRGVEVLPGWFGGGS